VEYSWALTSVLKRLAVLLQRGQNLQRTSDIQSFCLALREYKDENFFLFFLKCRVTKSLLRHWWLTLVILATSEVEISRITV
jgi:hypothetical protein